MVASSKQSPRPSLIDCRAGGACCPRACLQRSPDDGRDLSITDYTNPQAFSENLVKCMENDWDTRWLSSVFPSVTKVTGKVMGAELTFDLLKTALKNDPQSGLQMIKDTYLKLARKAKQERKAKDDPWPVIIIDEANLLRGWTEKSSLTSLLAFFVYLTKQEHLAHVILATSDTFLTEWLESGALAPC